MYNENTPISFGKYKFTTLGNIPIKYLIKLYNTKSYNNDVDLKNYIEKNIDKMLSSLNEEIIDIPIIPICDKICYQSKKDAKLALNQIKNTLQDHKKPIRVYECVKCTSWHLTSLEIEEWNEKK